jgi:hypothetical protein
MSGRRALVRILVGAALALALTACVVPPLPKELPSVALGQTSLYRLEVALAAFYGCLLIVTPAYSGLAVGRLPVEISTRGARFAEGADHWAKLDNEAVEQIEERVSDLSQALADALYETEQLHQVAAEDNRQQGLDSEP